MPMQRSSNMILQRNRSWFRASPIAKTTAIFETSHPIRFQYCARLLCSSHCEQVDDTQSGRTVSMKGFHTGAGPQLLHTGADTLNKIKHVCGLLRLFVFASGNSSWKLCLRVVKIWPCLYARNPYKKVHMQKRNALWN